MCVTHTSKVGWLPNRNVCICATSIQLQIVLVCFETLAGEQQKCHYRTTMVKVSPAQNSIKRVCCAKSAPMRFPTTPAPVLFAPASCARVRVRAVCSAADDIQSTTRWGTATTTEAAMWRPRGALRVLALYAGRPARHSRHHRRHGRRVIAILVSSS